MTSLELYKWMASPSLLSKETLFELRQIVDDYPWFQAVKMLYLKNLAVLNDVRLDKELKKMAIFIPDRRKLFLLIKGPDANNFAHREDLNVRGAVKIGEETHVQGQFEETAEEFENTNPPVNVKKTSTNTVNSNYKVPPADYIGWLESNADDIEIDAGDDNRLRHQDLIDSYLENADNQLNLHSATDNISDNEGKKEKKSIEDVHIDDSYFTETLARVYLRQKKFDKALEIIRVLMTKYPEKSVYFADQIRYLERIINLNK